MDDFPRLIFGKNYEQKARPKIKKITQLEKG